MTYILTQTKLLVAAGEPSRNNERDDCSKNGKKGRNIFLITRFSADGEKRFLLVLFTLDKPFVTLFVIVLVDADLNFLLTELKFWK